MPSITSITPDKFDTGKSVTLAGSGFGTSEGSVLIAGQSQTITSWSDTSITFTTVRGSQSLGACRVDVVGGSGSTGTLIFSDDFTSGSPTGWTLYGTNSGGSLSVVDGAWKGVMAAGVNDTTVYATKNISAYNLSDVYIQFRAKMPASKHGIKFCKIFGQNNGGYANCTLGLDFTGIDNGAFLGVGYGDGGGSAIANDNTNDIYFKSSRTSHPGRATSPSISRPMNADFASTDWGTDWHTFRMRVKFNSGTTAENEVADGAFYVEIDGNVYLDASGIFNRHYSNPPINAIGFWNYTQGNPPSNFEIWYDDIKISTGGFVS